VQDPHGRESIVGGASGSAQGALAAGRVAPVADESWPLVSIVFLAYNRREALKISLHQVLEQLDYPADRLEVIVVDNASTDGTTAEVRAAFPQVQVIRNPENVGASAWNVGMTTARGDWRMILDDDCYIAGDALKTAVRSAEEHRAGLVSFRVISSEVPGYSFNDEYNTGLLTFWGCSAMFSREAIESEPFYDPKIFIWANEMELTMRLLNRGFRHLHLAEVESVHMKAPTSVASERAIRLNFRHFAYIAGKLLQPRDAAVAVANLALHLVFEAYSKERRSLRALPEIAIGFFTGLGSRSPVRPEVSAVYRRHVRHFVNPVRLLRSPLERIRFRGNGADIDEARLAQSARWFARRERFYPAASGVLEL
jgi:GT2 family glycosyltransferase